MATCRPLRPRRARRLHIPSSFTDDTGLTPQYEKLGALETPAIRSKRGIPFRGFLVRLWSKTCATTYRFARPPGGSDRAQRPAHGGFSVCAFAESVALLDGRYGYGGNWESSAGGTLTRKNVS